MQEFTDKTAPHQLPFAAFGVEMRVCTNSPDLLAQVEPMIPPGSDRRPRTVAQHRIGLLDEGNDIYSIYHEGICVHDAPGLGYALMMLDSQIQGYVALEASDYVFVHAGVVAVDGRAILMPGLSFSGKSTLVRALVKAGALYYSDEFAVLDERGYVHAYAKPLSYRPPNHAPPVDYPVEELGGVAGDKPCRVGMMIATRFRPDGEWNPRDLSPGAAALALMEHTVPARSRPEQTMRVLTKALDAALSLQGDRGEADAFAAVVLDTLRATV